MILYLFLLSFFSIANGLQCYNCVWLSGLEQFGSGEFPPVDDGINFTEKCVRPDNNLLESCLPDPGNRDSCSNITYFLKPTKDSGFKKDFNLYFRFCQDSLLAKKFKRLIQTKPSQIANCVRRTLGEILGDEDISDTIWSKFEMSSRVEYCQCFSDRCNVGSSSGDGNGDGGGNSGSESNRKLNFISYFVGFTVFVFFKYVNGNGN